MSKHVHEIAQRLSLRTPQRESLEILHHVVSDLDLLSLDDSAGALAKVQESFPSVEDFERDFPSLCFALATGVGKTRLMGAFIAYLFRAHQIRHFFVLAPNLTIYDKLIKDFTPNTPKYVFEGLHEFATRSPWLLTGDNYEQMNIGAIELQNDVIVNIFNISKVNSEVRGGRSPRIRRLSEYIGQSYFDYLAELDDLVLLLDESHRYRATAGARAINELKPILGLELTATPKATGTSGQPFKNVIYSYPLSKAMADGFVKEPAVTTRENFSEKNYTSEQLERLKLEDGALVHENTKVHLEAYARETGEPFLKPFMLVVAQDTTHADQLKKLIDDDGFLAGRYKGKVITVHSKLSGELNDDALQSLLNVESADEPVEIVIHVNKLGEGWDVKNLYTIVPLRASASEILTEQTIGRGLRLPYGIRTGRFEIDTLSIIAHDKFQAIIEKANEADSIIRKGTYIGRDVPDKPLKPMEAPTKAQNAIFGGEVPVPAGRTHTQPPLFSSREEMEVAKAAFAAIERISRLPTAGELLSEKAQELLVREVVSAQRYDQAALKLVDAVDVEDIVRKTTEKYVELTMRIPRIVVHPSSESRFVFHPFTWKPPNNQYMPVASDLLRHALSSGEVRRLGGSHGVVDESVLANYIVRHLIDFDDICYDENADLLVGLAEQTLHWLRSYLGDEEDLKNVLQYHGRHIAAHIHDQMVENSEVIEEGYAGSVSKGFVVLQSQTLIALADADIADYRDDPPKKSEINRLVYNAFDKCAYFHQKFDSDPERLFAAILEQPGNEVLKWVKPARGQFKIFLREGGTYNPDFVVETNTEMFICEPKSSKEVTNPEVLQKKDAAVAWCEHATKHAQESGGKPWTYLLIPDDEIKPTSTFAHLAARFRCA